MSNLETVLDKIRIDSRAIVKNGSIKLDDEKINRLIVDLLNSGASDHIIVSTDKLDIKSKIALIFLFGSVNYCFVNPSSNKEYQYIYNGLTMYRSTAFINALINSGIEWSNLKAVASMNYSQWCGILQLSEENSLYDSDGRFEKIRKFAGYLLTVKFDDFFVEYNSYVKIYRLLEGSGLFEDAFKKRAQIVLSMFGQLAKRCNINLCDDIQLTAMADYRLPQVFYNYGILLLNNDYSQKVISHQLIKSGEPIEVELRAWTIVICEIIAKKINASEEKVDGMIWSLSQRLIADNLMDMPAIHVMTDSY